MYYLIGAIIILFLLIFIFIYLFNKTKKIKFLDKIKNKYLRIIIRVLLLLIPFLIGFVNGVVVILHLAIFMIIFDIINIICKKKYSTLFDYLAIISTIVYLGIGVYQNFHIYETIYNIETKKDIGEDNFRIIQISDSHVGTTFDGNKFIEIVKKIDSKKPDIVVVTGDLVDDSTTFEDMVLACKALGSFHTKYGVYYVYGNHDKGYYNSNFSAEDLKNNLLKNKIIILEDEIANITDKILLIGRKDKSVNNRASIKDLTYGLDLSKYIIDLNHQPNDYYNESKSIVDLVLSGHSHGGQMFPLGPISKWINANDEYKGLHEINNTTFIVNTGISDWELLFKTFTKSEYVIVNIRGKHE